MSVINAENSFKHLLLVGTTGGCKTAGYILPNIYTLGKQQNFLIITDLSGEIHFKTSGYLKQQGFDIKVINPRNLAISCGYNPLATVKNSTDIDNLAKILINTANPLISSKDKVWTEGDKTILNIIMQILFNKGEKEYINLVNVLHLINNFGKDGDGIDEFIQRYATTTIVI